MEADPVDERLFELVAELVRDPIVQEKIQADPALRQRWENPQVRAVILRRP